MTDQTIEDRVERAQSQDMELTLVDTDPVVVQVYNGTSDRIHTVIPESVHCSCEDHTYRGMLCKHLIAVLDSDGHIGEIMREEIKQEKNQCYGEAEALRDELETTLDRAEAITEVLNVLGVEQQMAQTDQDAIQMLTETEEQVTDSQELAEIKAELNTDDDDEFAEMVENLTGAE